MNRHKKFFSTIGLNYLILGILELVLAILVINIADIVIPTALNDFNVFTILTAICNYVLPLPVFLYLMKRLKTTPIEKEKISIPTFITYIAITITLMWIGNQIGLALTSAIGTAIQTDVGNPVQNLINSADTWLNILLVSLIGPIFEEIIFRKLLIDRTIKYGARVSIILSAVIFAFFHGNLNQFCYAFLMGGFFAYVYIKTGDIRHSILLHIIINLMGSVISVFVGQAAENLAVGVPSFEYLIVAIYAIFVVVMLFVGIIALCRYKKAKFNGSKTLIGLKQPMKTVFLNYGIIFFIAFFTLQIIYQIFV